eukprot:3611712-Rhodomonas_salina.1
MGAVVEKNVEPMLVCCPPLPPPLSCSLPLSLSPSPVSLRCSALLYSTLISPTLFYSPLSTLSSLSLLSCTHVQLLSPRRQRVVGSEGGSACITLT